MTILECDCETCSSFLIGALIMFIIHSITISVLTYYLKFKSGNCATTQHNVATRLNELNINSNNANVYEEISTVSRNNVHGRNQSNLLDNNWNGLMLDEQMG